MLDRKDRGLSLPRDLPQATHGSRSFREIAIPESWMMPVRNRNGLDSLDDSRKAGLDTLRTQVSESLP